MAALGKLFPFIERFETMRDPSAQKHAQSVCNLTVQFARNNDLNLDIEELGQAATLHDVGKLLIPQELLAQKGRLSQGEFEVIRRHTTLGFELISPLKLGQLIEDGVLYHHENYDGSGYPSGLAGEDIPVAARIIRIIDMYDALITNRPYRLGYSRQQATRIMLEHRHCFDPKFFESFLKTFSLPVNFGVSSDELQTRYPENGFDFEH